ncbi:MAG: hypothetical protein KBD63_05275 [Bacteriovoracaceae bacterium]|nr:hypothetical protein [Bacteriovoracaceae bacterium]
MGILKDALLKAGVKPTEKVAPKKKVAPPAPQVKKEMHSHQVHRNICELCNRTTQDVEYYNHRNAIVRVKWLCLICADQNSIADNFRESNQSEDARRGAFRRFYGATKKFPK